MSTIHLSGAGATMPTMNTTNATSGADIPSPAGATEVLEFGHYCGRFDGSPNLRYFWGTDRDGVQIRGSQTRAGVVDRWIGLDFNPDNMNPDLARDLAARLLAAADEMEALAASEAQQ